MVQIDPFGSFAQGVSLRNNMNQQRANVQAAQGLASGNYAQALGALGGVGDVDGVVQVQNAQAANQERELEQHKQRQAQQLQTTMQIIGTVKRARDSGQDVSQILPQYRDAFIAMGTDPQQLAQIEQQVAANPAFLDQIENIIGEQARKIQIQNLGNGYAVAIDEGTGQLVNEYRAPRDPVNVNGVWLDPETREVIFDTRAPTIERVNNTDGSTSVIAIDQPAPIRGSGAGNGSFESVIGPLLQREGGYVARDGSSGAPANYGINQRANPDVNVRDLTPQAATELYRERYWNPVVEAGVPAEAREAVFDFAVNAGPQRAINAWRQSGGDINAFNQARLEHYRRQPDYAQFGRSWERRVAETTPGTVDTRGGMRVVAQGENRGLTPAQQRAEERASQTERAANQRTEVNLRKEFDSLPEVKAYKVSQQAYRGLEAAATGPATSGSDLSLIFQFMKVLDPTSVVREGEFATAQNSGSAFERVGNLYNRVLNGTRLNERQRQDFLQQGRALAQASERTYAPVAERYRSYAQDYGVSPDRVAPVQGQQNRQRPQTNTGGAIRFNLTPAQLRVWQQLGRNGGDPSAPLGSTRNPRWINEAAAGTSYNNIPRGSYYYDPNGQIRQKR